jgi:hypothetical protein
MVLVTDCPDPVMIGRLLTTATPINPGDALEYSIALTNPGSSALSNVVITVEQRLSGQLINSATLSLGTVDAGATVEAPYPASAPFPGGDFAVTINAPGVCATQPPVVSLGTPGGSLLITEMVLSPQQDWNDSSGGNGVPFDAVPGGGTINSDDIWIELSGGVSGTESWLLCLTDAAAAQVCQPLGPPTPTQTRLKAGWGALTMPIVQVEVFGNGVRLQNIDVAGIESVIGPATGINDESLAWSIHGVPSPLMQQFLRRMATINLFLPF